MVIIRVFITSFIITLLSCKSSKLHVGYDLSGEWEFDKVLIDDKIIDAANLNECKFRDVIKIDSVDNYDLYSINKQLKGYLIGSSNNRICSVNVETFEYEVHGNSCYTSWVL